MSIKAYGTWMLPATKDLLDAAVQFAESEREQPDMAAMVAAARMFVKERELALYRKSPNLSTIQDPVWRMRLNDFDVTYDEPEPTDRRQA